MTCRRPLPRWRSATASKCAASLTRCCSAWRARSGSRWSGRSSTARIITLAWSGSRSPAARASRTGVCPWVRLVARRVLRWASVRVIWVAWAHQFATEVAPTCSATPTVSAWAATRASSSVIREATRVSRTSTSAVSSVGMDHSEASVTWSRAASSWVTACVTWWWGFACAVIATPEKKFAATVYRTGVRDVNMLVGLSFRGGGREAGSGGRPVADLHRFAAKGPQPRAGLTAEDHRPGGFETVAAQPPQPPGGVAVGEPAAAGDPWRTCTASLPRDRNHERPEGRRSPARWS
ncbi:hypothetical protein HIDPHFAB_04339 [Nocardioides sp. T2.26MG-1]|nr:hypothetical protein HIDPHFAB_04339 [Nocardioides sp. T2.26MG-1]